MANEAACSEMQYELFDGPDGTVNAGSLCGKTFQAHSVATQGEILQKWLGHWLGPSLAYRPMDGKQPALLSAEQGWSSGACWTRSGSECPKDAVVSSLSQILETGPVDPRYYLSPKACAGILRRAEKRGKKLPERLKVALEKVAAGVIAQTMQQQDS